jgi:hypothetical protein
MTAHAGARRFFGLSSTVTLCTLAFLCGSCNDPATYVPFPDFSGPAGVLEGTLTYSGPPPCTENGRIVGAAVVLAFDARVLPPPEGLGTGAESIDAISGEELFASIRHKLVFDKDNALRCPDASAPYVTASGTWSIAPLRAATYQVRGFYDRDGDFNPAFSISNLPTAGDVGGGAVDNATAVAQGLEAPRFTRIDLGVPDASGNLVIPETGSAVIGIGVTLGQVLPLERPVFYPSEVKDTTGVGNTDPRNVVLPSDFQFKTFGASDGSFIRIVYTAGVAPTEINAAAITPFFLPVKNPPPTLYMAVQDVNRDGMYDAQDHVPESTLLPALYPLTVFSKLIGDQKLVGLETPRVIMQGITLDKSLIGTITKLPTDPTMPPYQGQLSEVTVALRPAAVCINPKDPAKNGVLVVSHQTDEMGTTIISDEASVKAGLEKQFGRPFDIAYGCLPEGRYAMNLVYPTGQAWTLPNEAGVCAPAEPMTADGANCQAVKNSRPRLASQDAWLTVGAPKDKAYCTANPTPAACKPL